MNTPTVDFARACEWSGTRCRAHLCHIDNCKERGRLRALLAEHNTPVKRFEHVNRELEPYAAGFNDALNAVQRAEHNTPTPDPPPRLSDLLPPLSDADADQYRRDLEAVDRAEQEGYRLMYGGAVPVQEPTCTTCGDTKLVPGWQPCSIPAPPCPVCAVPNPESIQ